MTTKNSISFFESDWLKQFFCIFFSFFLAASEGVNINDTIDRDKIEFGFYIKK